MARFHGEIVTISPERWNCHNKDNYPFLSHSFLQALEKSGSVGQKAGMRPMHMELFHQEESVGFIPLYLKFHSYGEYIFDWEWARGAQDAGIEYYPKLLIGAPYTPAVGNRLLMQASHYEAAGNLLRLFCQQHEISSVHILHCLKQEAEALSQSGFIKRETHQYHFHNDDYKSFDGFLLRLKSRHRKQIQKERAHALENGLSLALENGADLSNQDWLCIYELYQNTYQRKWGAPYLTPDFFLHLPAEIQKRTLVATARDEKKHIHAMSLSFESDSHLYGRYWGCADMYDAIHFEFCYYRLIEYAITSGKKVFEAGAQGEHKIKRGFVPVTIYSLHTFIDERLHAAVSHFCRSEAAQEDRIKDFLKQMAPFKRQTTA